MAEDGLVLQAPTPLKTRILLRQVPDCMVTGFEELIDGLVFPDVDDRHVLAAAIRAGARRTGARGKESRVGENQIGALPPSGQP